MENVMIDEQYVVVVINSLSIESKVILCDNYSAAVKCLFTLFTELTKQVDYDEFDTYIINDGTYGVVSYECEITQYFVSKLNYNMQFAA